MASLFGRGFDSLQVHYVESIWLPCLDEGSIPSRSTIKNIIRLFTADYIFYKYCTSLLPLFLYAHLTDLSFPSHKRKYLKNHPKSTHDKFKTVSKTGYWLPPPLCSRLYVVVIIVTSPYCLPEAEWLTMQGFRTPGKRPRSSGSILHL